MPKKRKKKDIPEHLKWLPEFKYEGQNLCELSPQESREAHRSWIAQNNASIDRTLQWIEAKKKEYQSGGNPLCVWGAYLAIRKMNLDVPEWIFEYFDKVGTGLYSDKNKPEDLALHLGFDLEDGGPAYFKKYANRETRQYAVAWVLNELEEPGASIDKACESAAAAVKERWGDEIEPETIKKWYYRIDM